MLPAAGFEVIAEHIMNLMTKIDSLKTEITSFKSVNHVSGFMEIS